MKFLVEEEQEQGIVLLLHVDAAKMLEKSFEKKLDSNNVVRWVFQFATPKTSFKIQQFMQFGEYHCLCRRVERFSMTREKESVLSNNRFFGLYVKVLFDIRRID
jgi:hypothetical protein